MKKILLVLFCCMSLYVNAQDNYVYTPLLSKKGTPIIPEAKDWSIGVDAVPFINYFGTLFTKKDSVQRQYFNFNPEHPFTIVGKYMKNDIRAYRFKFRIGYNIDKVNAFSQETGTPFFVTDSKKTTEFAIALGAGLQWFRGKGRLKGYYGAEAMVGIHTMNEKYTYGNSFSESTFAPASADFGVVLNDTAHNVFTNSQGTFVRLTEVTEGTRIGFGLRGFVGVEYFFAPKMSIGGEFGWGPSFESQGEGSVAGEFWNSLTPPGNLETTESKIGKEFTFSLDTDNANGALMLNFYF